MKSTLDGGRALINIPGEETGSSQSGKVFVLCLKVSDRVVQEKNILRMFIFVIGFHNTGLPKSITIFLVRVILFFANTAQ